MVMLDDTIAGRRIVPAVEEVTVSTSCVMKDAIPTYVKESPLRNLSDWHAPASKACVE
jgi:hypothetical protein